MDVAVLTAQEQVTAISKQMTDRFGVINVGDIDAMNYWLQKKKARVYFALGLAFIFGIGFEITMWYRSKYDFELYCEVKYAELTGKAPKRTKKGRSPKKSKPRSPKQGGVTNEFGTTDFSGIMEGVIEKAERNDASTYRNDSLPSVTEEDHTVTATPVDVIERPEPLPDGVRYCSLSDCTEKVTGRSRFCCTAHKQAAYRKRNG